MLRDWTRERHRLHRLLRRILSLAYQLLLNKSVLISQAQQLHVQKLDGSVEGRSGQKSVKTVSNTWTTTTDKNGVHVSEYIRQHIQHHHDPLMTKRRHAQCTSCSVTNREQYLYRRWMTMKANRMQRRRRRNHRSTNKRKGPLSRWRRYI